MKISVIVTVYNLEKYIEATLTSIFKQTRQPDEIIVVDDCSTDSSARILLSYGNRIKYFKMQQNSGVLPAFLKGIDESTGDILSFLDGDDIWLPEKLSLIEKAFIENKNRILITHDFECVDGNGDLRAYVDNTHLNTKRIVAESGNDLQKMDALLRNSMLCFKGLWMGSAFCVNKKLIDFESYKKWVLSLPYPELSHQDQPLAAFIIINYPANELFFIDRILFQYRVFGFNSSGISNTVSSALRTTNRTYAMLIRVKDMASKNKSLNEENDRLTLHITYNRFLENLYSKKYLPAIKKYFILAFRFWDFKWLIRETQRLVFIIVFGPAGFLKYKSRV